MGVLSSKYPNSIDNLEIVTVGSNLQGLVLRHSGSKPCLG